MQPGDESNIFEPIQSVGVFFTLRCFNKEVTKLHLMLIVNMFKV